MKRKVPNKVTRYTADFFARYQLTPIKYFVVGSVLSVVFAFSVRLATTYLLTVIATVLGVALFGWLIWWGPTRLRRYNRTHVLLLGTLAYFVPLLSHACIAWLGQQGWPLEATVHGRYMDTLGLLGLFLVIMVVFGLLWARMRLYDALDTRRRARKNLSR